MLDAEEKRDAEKEQEDFVKVLSRHPDFHPYLNISAGQGEEERTADERLTPSSARHSPLNLLPAGVGWTVLAPDCSCTVRPARFRGLSPHSRTNILAC